MIYQNPRLIIMRGQGEQQFLSQPIWRALLLNLVLCVLKQRNEEIRVNALAHQLKFHFAHRPQKAMHLNDRLLYMIIVELLIRFENVAGTREGQPSWGCGGGWPGLSFSQGCISHVRPRVIFPLELGRN